MERSYSDRLDRRSTWNSIITFRNFCLGLAIILLPGCFYDYAIVDTNPETEIVYVETPGSGDGATVPLGDVWVDSFTQPTSANGVDVLWVIDTSGSMRTFQDELLVGIESMLNALPPSGWRLNMISNSPDKAAIDNQFPLVPGDDILDAEAMYNAMSVGHQEEGFDATYEYIVNNPYASTWMRHDAALLVVLVSDEEDQSNNHFPVVNDFVWWYTGLRTSVYLASIINLDPAVSLCNSSTHNAGYRYEDATGQLGGTVVDICSGDWSPGVTDASIQIEPYEEWTLSQAPIIDTITVFYDGIVDWRWIYDSDTSTVIFTTTPPAGALVEIVYIIAEETETADTGDTDTGS